MINKTNIAVFILVLFLIIKIIILISGVYGSYTMRDEWAYINLANDLKKGHFYYQDSLGVQLAQQNYIDIPIKHSYWPHDDQNSKFFNSYSIGYPLILTFFMIIFGYHSIFYINILFLCIAVFGIFYLIKEITKNHRYSDWIALSTSVLILTYYLFTNVAINKIATLSSLAFLIWGIWFLFKGINLEKYKLFIPASFFLGFAATIRITNILIILPLVIYFLILRKKIFGPKLISSLKRFIILLTVFLVGLVPFFVQNQLSTGNPLVSVYVPRHLEDLRPEHFVNAGKELNTPPTIWLFTKKIFSENYVWILHLILILLGAGLLFLSKNYLGTFLIISSMIFLVFFSLWGRVVLRYYVFVYVMFFFLKSFALFYLLDVYRNKVKKYFSIICVTGIGIFIFINPVHFYQNSETILGKYSELEPLSIEDGKNIGQEVKSLIKDNNAIIITSRDAEAILYLHTDIEVYNPIFKEEFLKEAVNFINTQNRMVYFLHDGNREEEKLTSYKKELEKYFRFDYVDILDYFKNNRGEFGQLYQISRID